MQLKLPVVLLSALALAAPGAMSYGKDKDKDKNKDKKEQNSDDRRGDRDDDDDRDHRDGDGKLIICHIPPGNSSARQTMRVSDSAWDAHRAHGDRRGPCAARRLADNPRRFSELDTNNDARLSFSEFHGDRARFDRLDNNNDGSLSREEYYDRR